MTVKKVNAVLQPLLVIMMTLLVVDVTWQVLTRFVLPQPSSFTEEVARFLLIWMSLLGGAYAFHHNMHLGFDLIVKKFPPAVAKLTYRFCLLLVAIFAISVLIGGGINLVILTWSLGQHSPVMNVPMAYIYLVLPLSGVLFLLYSVDFFFSTFNANNLGEK
jgi:TRAP-type C4-dicarboxylate transport system permease small subunit